MCKPFNPERLVKINCKVHDPTNEDSIGIELVSGFSADKGYEPATKEQNDALAWLVSTLEDLLGLAGSDIYRHSEIGYKQPTEASTARW